MSSTVDELDQGMRLAAFSHVRRLNIARDPLTSADLRAGFMFEGSRYPLINPQRGIFKPQKMRYLLSTRTVFPRPGTALRAARRAAAPSSIHIPSGRDSRL
ncbi:MAG TPA: hypothetical protein PKZ76_06605 [Xanthomonadaceae bacterium]|nr:hypothetical protein [Xanthomonadaceae bacterium]